ncbi:MAG TPA: Trk system potassium transporter TrkA [Patescibacteria group bacterium]|nr:Trk system potassium transporter TrkA [Patescibacteria group bacterium]
MKVVICGAGQVGSSIAAYLAEEGNNVSLIDRNAELIAEVNENLDVTGIVGHASNPDVLNKAGTADAEMIVAATYSDEVNMVACQVAHSLFRVPMKIARVRAAGYLNPAWAALYSRDHMPIDVVISPEVEVAKSIANRLRVPGAFNIIPMADGLVQLVSVICKSNCPLVHTPLKHLTSLFPELVVEIVAIIRGHQQIIPGGDDEILPGDEVYFVSSTEHLQRAMAAFGYENQQTRRVVIAGAGKIGTLLAAELTRTRQDISIRLIDADFDKATRAAEELTDIMVVHGDGLSKEILEEANISEAEALIAVMNHDESNILASMLAKQHGCQRAITLVNNPAFTSLVTNLGIDAIVNPRAITVSTILQHVRRGRIKAAHSLRDGFAEILEVEALDTSAIVNTPIREIKRPKNMIFGLIVRGKNIIAPRADTVIKPDDRVIILAAHDQVKRVEQMFAVRPEYF